MQETPFPMVRAEIREIVTEYNVALFTSPDTVKMFRQVLRTLECAGTVLY